MTPRPEAKAAAKWWADWLRKPTSGPNILTKQPETVAEAEMNNLTGRDWNSEIIGIRADIFTNRLRRPSPEEANLFEKVLAEKLEDMLNEEFVSKTWDRSNPRVGQAWRVVRTDYSALGELHDAIRFIGYSSMIFPMKTCMWINPGEVRVGLGYRAEPRTIWSD